MKYSDFEMKVYLSSTKYSIFSPNGYSWKSKFKSFLDEWNKEYNIGTKYYDPLQFESDKDYVVPMDKYYISDCDYFVCYLDKLSIGTLMELMYLYDINNSKYDFPHRTCVLIDPSKKHRKHPWIEYHCDNIFDNVEDAAKFVIEHMVTKINS